MIKKTIALCLIALLLLFIGRCTEAEDIKTEEEVQEAVIDVSEDVSEISHPIK